MLGSPNLTVTAINEASRLCSMEARDDFLDLHGDPLNSVVGGFPDDWLRAALFAGYLPALYELELALAAHLVVCRATPSPGLAPADGQRIVAIAAALATTLDIPNRGCDRLDRA